MTQDDILGRDQEVEKSGSNGGSSIAGGKDASEDKGPESLMETLGDPDPDANPADNIEDEGEPFSGNHA